MLLFAANGHYLDLKVARLLNRNKPRPWISAFTTARIDHWSRRDEVQFHLKVWILLWRVAHGEQDRVHDLMYVYAQPAEQEETGYDIWETAVDDLFENLFEVIYPKKFSRHKYLK